MSFLFYHRPDYVAKLPGPMSVAQCQIYVERTQKHRRAVPPGLSFESVVTNRAMPPCSLRDFMDYMVFVSHDAENLQFWLWLRDYSERFFAAPRSEQVLSPPWQLVEGTHVYDNNGLDQSSWSASRSKKDVSEFETQVQTFEMSKFPPMSPGFDSASMASGPVSTRTFETSVEETNSQMGLKWQSFSIQPFRSEINRIISHYLAPNSPRELNLSHRNRAAVLHALQHTTHPSAFRPIKDMVESSLRNQSHPNFIRWSICNGNKPRVDFVRNSGIMHIVAGLVLGIVLVLSDRSRWWRFFVLPLLFVGFSISISAYKGLCVIVHSSHSRSLRPWEQFCDVESKGSLRTSSTLAAASTDEIHSPPPSSHRDISLDPFGTRNDFDHQPWVDRYRRKPLVRKIFAPTVWVKDDTIRVLQDRIVLQSYLLGLLFTIPLTTMFVALPEFKVL